MSSRYKAVDTSELHFYLVKLKWDVSTFTFHSLKKKNKKKNKKKSKKKKEKTQESGVPDVNVKTKPEKEVGNQWWHLSILEKFPEKTKNWVS